MSIRFEKERFIIETENTSYVILLREETLQGTTEKLKFVCFGYWGEKLLYPTEVPNDYYVFSGNAGCTEYAAGRQEYPAYGAKYFDSECLKAKFSDGVRDLRLSYKSYEIANNGNELKITLCDIHYPVEVDLYYKIFEGLDLIDRHTVIRNIGTEPITLETVYSASWSMPYSDNLQLTYMSSAWGEEYKILKQPLNQSPVLLESRAGVSNATAYPYFAVDCGNAEENRGNVWFGTLQYSGNWQIKAGRDHNRAPQIVGGISDFNTKVHLLGGKEFETPVFTGGMTNGGFGAASRQLHEYQRKTSNTMWTNKVMPVLYNAWATFEFNLDEKMLMQQAERCHSIGIEMFLIDDGWFKNRNDDKSGLGDWDVDPQKFPNGLTPLINKLNELGMMFGIWVEPEMCTEESELYKNHPEWILHYPTRQPVKKRNQYVLNLGLEEVYQYTIGWLDKLLSENNIGYLKWDMNRFLSEVNWNGITNEPDDEVYIKYVKNLWRVFDHINEKFPNVLIENCASGGMRADLAMTKRCARVNRSDNQDCIDALILHEGFTKVNLSKAAGGGCHMHHKGMITVSSRQESYKRMAYTGMMGSFSVGFDLRKLTDEETEELKGYIKLYKELRETVQLGDMYLLRSAYDPTAPAVIYQFVSKDKNKSVVFFFNNNKGFTAWLGEVKLQGLDPDKVYKISIKGDEEKSTRDHFPQLDNTSGDTLMKMGLTFKSMRALCQDSTYGCFAAVLEAE